MAPCAEAEEDQNLEQPQLWPAPRVQVQRWAPAIITLKREIFLTHFLIWNFESFFLREKLRFFGPYFTCLALLVPLLC